MINRFFKQLLILFCLVAVLMLPYFVFADSAAQGILKEVGGNSGFAAAETTETTFAEILGMVVSTLLGLLGVVFISLMLYGGYNWMTARGDESMVETAKKTITRAVIGLIITVSAYAIWNFIFWGVNW